MNDWFDSLGDIFVEMAARRRAPIEAPRLDGAVAQELLELARVVAHTQERRFAPLASFMAGVAVERWRHAQAGLTPEDESAYLRDVRTELENQVGSGAESPAPGTPMDRHPQGGGQQLDT